MVVALEVELLKGGEVVVGVGFVGVDLGGGEVAGVIYPGSTEKEQIALHRIILTQDGRYTIKVRCANEQLCDGYAQKGLGSPNQTGDQII